MLRMTEEMDAVFAVFNEWIDLDSFTFAKMWPEINQSLNTTRANAWDEGFNAGHYYEGEKQECDCRKNPYREDA